MRSNLVHALESRRLLAAAAPVAELSISDIPEPLPPVTAGTAVGDAFYFARASDARVPNGSALWTSDGTPATTRLVGRLNSFGHVSNVFPYNGAVYTVETNVTGSSSVQVWTTNPATGVSQPLPAGTGTVYPNPPDLDFTVFNNALYFVSDVLWKYDPSVPNVSPRNVQPTGIRSARSLTTFGGAMYFLTDDGLWKSDGTFNGTNLLYFLGNAPSNVASPIVTLNDGMLFVRDGKLYRSDGTFNGTVKLFEAAAGAGPTAMPELTVAGGRAYFVGRTDAGGYELFSTDGTAAGTGPVADVRAGPSSSLPRHLTASGGRLYFDADDGEHGRELWSTDGTAAGTALVGDLSPGAGGAEPDKLTSFGGGLYFAASAPGIGRELFVTDGTAAGTRPVGDLFPGEAGSMPQLVIPGATKLVFTALHPAYGYSAFVLDSDGSGPTLLADLIPGALNERIPLAGASRGDVFYADGESTSTGREPYALPQGGAARLLADLEPGVANSNPLSFVAVGDAVLFRATTAETGTEVWRSDGATVELLRDGVPPVPNEAVNESVSIQGPYFGRAFINYSYSPSAGGTVVREAWASGGTPGTTVKVGDFNFGRLVSMGDWLYAINGSAGAASATLVRYNRDGTGSQALKTVPSSPPVNPPAEVARNLTAVGGMLYFAVFDGTIGYELWRSDGTAAGTIRVKDLAPGPNSSSPSGFAQVRGSTAVFAASPDYFAGAAADLWVTDGTAAGTVKLKDARPGMRGSAPRDFVSFNGAVYFTADDGAVGRELWKTDGTSAGTVLVKDIRTGAAGSAPAEMKVVGGRLYFTADDGESGRELWASDGTAAGTARAEDINPGPGSSDPLNLTDVSGDLYFTANDGTRPRLYRLGHPAPRVVARQVFYNNSFFDGRSAGASPLDDGAIATDKEALLPGQSPTWANVTSYTRGINGVMIDLAGRPPRTLRPDDFQISAGRGGDPATWPAAPQPTSVTVRTLAAGVDRVTLVWPDGLLRNTWVRVAVKAEWDTGLSEPDVFYFGNLVGAAGGAAPGPDGTFSVASNDYVTARGAARRFASRTERFDFDRDGTVNVLDLLAARRARLQRVTLTALA
jgi:ELWxxDGT repeat protein